MAEVESAAVLAITENEVCEAASEGVVGTRKYIVEPIGTALTVGLDCIGQAGNNEASAAAGLQSAVTFPEHAL